MAAKDVTRNSSSQSQVPEVVYPFLSKVYVYIRVRECQGWIVEDPC